MKTTEKELNYSIYEALNDLDYALSGEEIAEVQKSVIKDLKDKTWAKFPNY